MFTRISLTPMYVTDQDEALEFYVGKLGFEVESDVDLGEMRWLTIRLASDPHHRVLLQRIGDRTATGTPETAEMLRELTERGTSSWMILASDDCRGDHRRLVEAGVEITQEPTEQFYGIDMAIRDPYGNMIRITEESAR